MAKRLSISIVVVLMCCGRLCQPAGAADVQTVTTQPASTQPAEFSPADLSALINKLADPDPAAREQASKTLWSAGRPAEPALRKAAASDIPEVSRRARAILRDFTYGLYPDAPPEVFTLLDAYRKGDPLERRMAVWGLSTKGIAGLRVLLKLSKEEQDPNVKQVIAQVLTPREHEVTELMLAQGDIGDVEQRLATSSLESEVAAQDYAALLLTTGKLPQAIAAIKGEPLTLRNSTLRVALERAAGDLLAARAAAEKSGSAELLEAVLIEQKDWKTLAARVATLPEGQRSPEQLGYLCAYSRLGHDAAGYRSALKLLNRAAEEQPDSYSACADALFLNDATDQATTVLLHSNHFLEASDFLASRLRFADALALPKQALQLEPERITAVNAKTVATLQFLGQTKKAADLMAAVARDNQLRNDFSTWVYLVESAQEMDQKQKANDFAAIALEKATAQDPIAWLFEKMRLGDGGSAAEWWHFLRQTDAEQTTAQSLDRLRAIQEQTLNPTEWERLAESARRYAIDLPAPEQEVWRQTVADTLTSAGRPELALPFIARLEDSSTPAVLIHAGDFRADRKDWNRATADYEKAWERDDPSDRDHTKASALFLHGWALAQSGRDSEGAAMMEAAHRLPMGSQAERFALLETLTRHKLMDDAHREMDLIIHATAARSYERNETMRRSAEEKANKGDDVAAADMWDQAFLQNLSPGVAFAEPWANVVVPSLIHKTRAMGLIQAGQIDRALDEGKIALTDNPADADMAIDLVNALDKAGHRAEADNLYDQQRAIYEKCVADYPDSGQLHNQLSWLQVMCHRELDDALKNGQRAVELEPNSTASRDTLAEVFFARGDPTAAAAQMKRCIELEPRVLRHQQQLARFDAAAAGKK